MSTASVYLGRAALRAVERAGGDARALAERTGIDWFGLDDEAVVPFENIIELWLLGRDLTDDDCFGISCALAVDPTSEHLLFCLLAASPSLWDALTAAARYVSLVHTSKLGIRREPGVVTIVLTSGLPPEYSAGPSQFVTALTVRFVELATGVRPVPVRAAFSHPRPARSAPYAEWFGPNVAFEQDRDEIALDEAVLALPMRTANPTLRTLLAGVAEAQVQRQAVGDPLFAALRKAILDALPSADANVERVARTMGVTSRTLQRKLQDRGTTFLDELERVRKDAARAYVGSTQTAISDIALLLGFSAVASFSRAFRRWFGCSPSEFRRADAGATRSDT